MAMVVLCLVLSNQHRVIVLLLYTVTVALLMTLMTSRTVEDEEWTQGVGE